MTAGSRAGMAVAALGLIAVITASWWALALWPAGGDAPEWLLRTREVCFGATADRLPNAGGWMLLVGQPASMVLLLMTVWGTELRDGLARARARLAGQLALGVLSAVLVAGLVGVFVRVGTAGMEPFDAGSPGAAALTRVNDVAPAFALVDQTGRELTLDAFRGRPVIVTFAYAHCQTICPVIVSDVVAARRRLGVDAPEALVVTLDPWRDTPGRLATIARQWGVDDAVHVLSGGPEAVEHVLNRWRVPRVRNERTGDISHPSIIYVVGPDGRIAYVVSGNADVIAAAVRSL